MVTNDDLNSCVMKKSKTISSLDIIIEQRFLNSWRTLRIISIKKVNFDQKSNKTEGQAKTFNEDYFELLLESFLIKKIFKINFKNYLAIGFRYLFFQLRIFVKWEIKLHCDVLVKLILIRPKRRQFGIVPWWRINNVNTYTTLAPKSSNNSILKNEWLFYEGCVVMKNSKSGLTKNASPSNFNISFLKKIIIICMHWKCSFMAYR